MRKTPFTKALNPTQEDAGDLRRGPWTLEEDNVLKNYISRHGEGRWNLLAKYAGLKRTGKSCRLRWLNYLKPDIKRGNLTPQEQLLILQLHSKWGNRWSKIAQHLPGRTDNEIKNYWRTRVQKQARLLRVESNSRSFTAAVRNILKQKLLENDYNGQNPPYNNSLANYSSSPLLATNMYNNSLTNFHLQNSTTTFFNISLESPSTLRTQVTENSSQFNNLNVMTSSDSSPVLGHVPAVDPFKSPISSGPSSHANSVDGEKNAVAVHESYEHDHDHDNIHNHVVLEDNYCVDSRSYDMEDFPMHTMSVTGDHYDVSLSTTGCQLEGSEWDYSNLPGGYWNMDDIWQFREMEEFGYGRPGQGA